MNKKLTGLMVAAATICATPMIAQAAGTTDGSGCKIYASKPYAASGGVVKGYVSRFGSACSSSDVTGKLIHARWGPDLVVADYTGYLKGERKYLSTRGTNGDVYFTKIYGTPGSSVASDRFTF